MIASSTAGEVANYIHHRQHNPHAMRVLGAAMNIADAVSTNEEKADRANAIQVNNLQMGAKSAALYVSIAEAYPQFDVVYAASKSRI